MAQVYHETGVRDWMHDFVVKLACLREKATPAHIRDMLQEYENMIKIVVDIRRQILAGSGEMHADCEDMLLGDGSEQDDLWGANWYPFTHWTQPLKQVDF